MPTRTSFGASWLRTPGRFDGGGSMPRLVPSRWRDTRPLTLMSTPSSKLSRMQQVSAVEDWLAHGGGFPAAEDSFALD
jgi:hypothetical protein